MRAQRAATGCIALSLVGLGVCGYLVYVHLGLLRGELLGGAVCGGAGAFNCHAVIGGAYGAFFGIPLAVWGLVGYVGTFSLAVLAKSVSDTRMVSDTNGALTLLAGLALVMGGVDLYLLWVMVGVIGALCPFCLLTDVVNLCLLVVAGRSLTPPWTQALRRMPAALGMLVPGPQRPAALAFWGMMALGVGGSLGLNAAVGFVAQGTPSSVRERIQDFIGKQTPVTVDTSGDPAVGPPDAPLQVVEFSDFFCPLCRKASKMNAILQAGHRRDARFVFKHFPLDTTCNGAISRTLHPGACQVAVASECAHQQGKFRLFHDRIFEKGRGYKLDSFLEEAGRLGLDVERFKGCMSSGEGLEAVTRDIAEAARLGINSTPVYFINGIRIDGIVTPATFEGIAAVLESEPRTVNSEQ